MEQVREIWTVQIKFCEYGNIYQFSVAKNFYSIFELVRLLFQFMKYIFTIVAYYHDIANGFEIIYSLMFNTNPGF